MAPPSEKSPYRLLVEGSDDRHSVIHLLARHGFDWDDARTIRPFVKETEGIDKLLEAFPVTLKTSHQRIGIIADANGSPLDRWAQFRNRALEVGVDLPARPDPDGTVVDGLREGMRIGIWLMPDNSSPGLLEDFLRSLVPEEDGIWTYAEEVVPQARQRGAKCKVGDHLKSTLHTWLAWQEEPGLPFGTAIKAQVFRHDSEDALRFVGWFRRLFVEN